MAAPTRGTLSLPEPWASIKAVAFEPSKQHLPDASAQEKFKKPLQAVNPLQQQWECIRWVSSTPDDLHTIRRLALANSTEEIRQVPVSQYKHVSLWLDTDGHIQVLVPRIDPVSGDIDCKALGTLNKNKQKHVFRAGGLSAIRDAWQRQNVGKHPDDDSPVPLLPTALLIDGKACETFKKPVDAAAAPVSAEDEDAMLTQRNEQRRVRARPPTGAAALPNAASEAAATAAAAPPVDLDAEREQAYRALVQQQVEFFGDIRNTLGELVDRMLEGGSNETFAPRGAFASKQRRDDSQFVYQIEDSELFDSDGQPLQAEVALVPGAYEPNFFAIINSILYELPGAAGKSRASAAHHKSKPVAQKRPHDDPPTSSASITTTTTAAVVAAAAAEPVDPPMPVKQPAESAATHADKKRRSDAPVPDAAAAATNGSGTTSKTAALLAQSKVSAGAKSPKPASTAAASSTPISSAALARQCLEGMPLFASGLLSEQFAEKTLGTHDNGKIDATHAAISVIAGRLCADVVADADKLDKLVPLVRDLLAGSGLLVKGGEVDTALADVKVLGAATKVYEVKWTMLAKNIAVPTFLAGLVAFFRAKGVHLVEAQLAAALEPLVAELTQLGEREARLQSQLSELRTVCQKSEQAQQEMRKQLADVEAQLAKARAELEAARKGPTADELMAQDDPL